MKISVWHIDGYRGFNEYNGKNDDNVHIDLAFDEYFKKDEVVKMLYKSYFTDYYKTAVISNIELKKYITV